jgi:peptidyl-prolyl cis-trans isomerase B (cyclophilin B)
VLSPALLHPRLPRKDTAPVTSKRERAYAKRRQEKFAQKLAAKEAGRTRSRVVNAVVVAVAVLVAVGGVAFALTLGGDEDTEAGAEPTTAGTVADDAGTAAPAEQTDTTCPPAPEAVATPPEGFDTVPEPVDGTWTVALATSCGDITLELDGDAAPQGVGSFVSLAEEGWFDETPCHRLTTQGIFVLQCGDPTGLGTGGPGYRFGPVENAPADDVYPAGTVAMARVGGDGESMGSQFFLVYEDSTIPSDAAGGYTVLGRVTEGLDIVQLVAEGGLAADQVAPARSIGIVSVTAEESA